MDIIKHGAHQHFYAKTAHSEPLASLWQAFMFL